MANEEHLKILKQGAKAWYQWREKSIDIKPNLYEANLSGANLREIELNDANLKRAKLVGADLWRSDLSRADLDGADLSKANISESILIGASFKYAKLNGANLSRSNLAWTNLRNTELNGANLIGANLLRAHLDSTTLNEANFSSAVLVSTVLSRLDLSVVIGLDTVHHHGPSSMSIDTLLLSKGSIPEAFLRGAGIPDSLITYAASLTRQAILFYSCFISYSSKDESFAKVVYADLQNNGVRCWFAPEDLKIGDKTRVQIDESIRVYDKLLLILSKQSITSDWVEKEVETAMELERQQKRTVLFPVRLDDEVMKIQSGWAADIRRSRNIGDFRNWTNPEVYKKMFDRLLHDPQSRKKEPSIIHIGGDYPPAHPNSQITQVIWK